MELADLIKAIIGLAVGSLGTYLGLHWKIRKELIAQYDREIRSERIKHYQVLWGNTELLAKYSPSGPVTKVRLEELATTLRHWYFTAGGIFLSDRARDAYFEFQKEIIKALALLEKPGSSASSVLQEIDLLRMSSSRLRTTLTLDIGSRNRPLLNESSEA